MLTAANASTTTNKWSRWDSNLLLSSASQEFSNTMLEVLLSKKDYLKYISRIEINNYKKISVTNDDNSIHHCMISNFSNRHL